MWADQILSKVKKYEEYIREKNKKLEIRVINYTKLNKLG